MATLSEIKNYAKDKGYVNAMEELGFSLGPDKFWFFRKRGDYLDTLSFWLSSSKIVVTTPIDCQRFDLLNHCDLTRFPKGFTKGYGICSDCFLEDDGLMYAGWSWLVETQEQMEESVDKIFKVFKIHGEPWLAEITDDEKMFNSYSLRFRETETGEKLKKYLNLV
jgi:hypothetical protein